MSVDFSFITYSALPDLDPDDRLVLAALKRRGYGVQALVWNDPKIDWQKAGVCVVRSTWDYHRHYAEFRRWLQGVAPLVPLINSAKIMLWNSRKTYLQDLSDQGVAIVPTRFIDKTNGQSLESILRASAWSDAIVKPVVGLCTAGVKRVKLDDRANLEQSEEHLRLLLADDTVMIQPYIASVADYGERSQIFFDGEYSHSIRRAPFQQMGMAGQVGETLAQPCQDEIDFARRVLSKLEERPAYARVDLVRDNEGKLLLMELELVEPSLFLSFHKPAADRFAEILACRVQAIAAAAVPSPV